MKFDSIFSKMRDLLHSSAGVKFSFGDPVKVGDLSIIPVAKVGFGMGGGGGKAPGSRKKKQNEVVEENADATGDDNVEFGGGAGGGIKTDPVGIYTIKGDRVKFYPVITVRETVGIVGFTLLLLFRISKIRRKKK